jgi:hypothetical protein
LSAIRQQLRSVFETAKRLGYYSQECEARLTLAELEMISDPALGRSRLEILEKETHERGLEFISHKAQLPLAARVPSFSTRSAPTPP